MTLRVSQDALAHKNEIREWTSQSKRCSRGKEFPINFACAAEANLNFLFPVGEQKQNESASSSPDSRRELIDLLEFEISRLESEQQRPGWTKWALAGASASCVWLLLDQFEGHSRQINFSSTLFLFLIWSFVWDTLIAIRGWLSSALPPANRRAGFFFTNMILAETRPLLSAKLLEKVCLLAIILASPLVPRNWVLYLGVYVFGGLSVLILAAILMTYAKLLIPVARPKHPSAIIWVKICGAVPVLLLLAKFIEIAANNISTFTIPELRVSLLLFAFTVIVPLILVDKIYNPFIEPLLELRRKLAVQEIDCAYARAFQ